ncbi:hypothetical protein [Nevskia sp.]|uniref:hypothetical protein n=1 Tax=Nevskia sp. TaxID=1929292 RepID=UPI003F716CE1
MNPIPKRLLSGLAALLLAGCGPNRVETPSRFPKPVMQPMAYSAALDADSAFSRYVHQEKLPPPGKAWTLSIGPASVDWMKNLLAAAFASFGSSGGTADLVFRPSIDSVQFSTPAQSRTEFYEAWIKYTVAVFDRGGRKLADWPIAAYGKRRDKSLASAEEGMGEALNKAMRDGAAGLALELRDPARIAALLRGPGAAPASSSKPPPAAGGNRAP